MDGCYQSIGGSGNCLLAWVEVSWKLGVEAFVRGMMRCVHDRNMATGGDEWRVFQR